MPDETNNGHDPRGGLERALDAFLLKSREQEQRDHSKFHASDAGRCYRMLWWRRKGVAESDPITPRMLRVFWMGKVMHITLQKMLKKAGLLYKAEMKLETKHLIGHIDALTKDVNADGVVSDRLVLRDFKSVHSDKFKYIAKEGDPHYRLQLATYYILLKIRAKKTFGRIVKSVVDYISKDDWRMTETPIGEADIQAARAYWKPLLQAWEKDAELAPNPTGWECRYCNFRGACDVGQRMLADAEARKAEKLAAKGRPNPRTLRRA